MLNKIKAWCVGAVAFFGASFSIALFFFKSRSARKEKKALEKKIENQEKYWKEKEVIESETQEKIDQLNSNNVDSFSASIELLHESSTADD